MILAGGAISADDSNNQAEGQIRLHIPRWSNATPRLAHLIPPLAAIISNTQL